MQISSLIQAAILIAIIGGFIFAVSFAVWHIAPEQWKPLAYLLGLSLAAAAVFLERYFKIVTAVRRFQEERIERTREELGRSMMEEAKEELRGLIGEGPRVEDA